jgi:alkyl hydroperoxide reductase subunit AhpC
MSLRLGDIAPDFSAETTVGPINFYAYLGNSWGVLFSHPADYTPVCTTELGKTAALQEEDGTAWEKNIFYIAITYYLCPS